MLAHRDLIKLIAAGDPESSKGGKGSKKDESDSDTTYDDLYAHIDQPDEHQPSTEDQEDSFTLRSVMGEDSSTQQTTPDEGLSAEPEEGSQSHKDHIRRILDSLD